MPVLTEFLSGCTILQLKEGISKGVNEKGEKTDECVMKENKKGLQLLKPFTVAAPLIDESCNFG